MATLITDPSIERRIRRQRARTGADRYDEVWDGVYVVSPLADVEHQEIVSGLTSAIQAVITWNDRGDVYAGVNLSDRARGWKQNYRVPDVAVFLRGTSARKYRAHWAGGPDFAAEVCSRGDRAREKLGFYAGLGTRELLLIERDPWRLELYRLDAGVLTPVGVAVVGTPDALASVVLPLSFRLVAGAERPRVEVVDRDSGRAWLA
jgi:Uma2 family endonuclease